MSRRLDAVFKLCVFGDGGVGKTTLVNKYLTGIFKDTAMTIGIDFHIKTLEVDGSQIRLQIWDFAGEERFRFLLPSYIVGASGGIFMYDITRSSSLRNLTNWLEAINNKASTIEEQIPILLVGGKIDLEENRAVDMELGAETAKQSNLCGFLECSAKTGYNVEEIFETITQQIIKKAEISDLNSDL